MLVSSYKVMRHHNVLTEFYSPLIPPLPIESSLIAQQTACSTQKPDLKSL